MEENQVHLRLGYEGSLESIRTKVFVRMNSKVILVLILAWCLLRSLISSITIASNILPDIMMFQHPHESTSITIPEKMRQSMIDLLPEEMRTIPLWNKNHTALISGGGVHGEFQCEYPTRYNSTQHKSAGRCCIGSKSGGGTQVCFGALKACPQDLATYQTIEKLAWEELNKYPAHNNKEEHMNCDVCRIVYIISSMKHHRLAIVGDSVQRQSFNAFECELFRRGFEISPITVKAWPPQPKKVPAGVEASKYGIKTQMCLHVTVPQWMHQLYHRKAKENHNGTSSLASNVEICGFSHLRPYTDMDQYKRIASVSDVMVVNYGLHYLNVSGQVNEFRSSLENLMNHITSETSLMCRETSAQHFKTKGGDYNAHDGLRGREFNQSDPTNKLWYSGCVPHNHHPPSWRRDLFQAVAKKSGYSIVSSFQKTKGRRRWSYCLFKIIRQRCMPCMIRMIVLTFATHPTCGIHCGDM